VAELTLGQQILSHPEAEPASGGLASDLARLGRQHAATAHWRSRSTRGASAHLDTHSCRLPSITIFKVSFRTKAAREARLRHASVQAQRQERRAAARDGSVSLSYKDIGLPLACRVRLGHDQSGRAW
jgi:hypothetical protein